jgi:hypothetical protein
MISTFNVSYHWPVYILISCLYECIKEEEQNTDEYLNDFHNYINMVN